MAATTITQRAQELKERFKAAYKGDPLNLDFWCSQYIAGDHNKELRREIIYILTQEKRPLSKCSLFAVSNELKNSFEQLTIF